jgi:succinylornithine transaminase family protein
MKVTRATYDQVMVPNYAPAQMVPVRGRGSRVWDQEGREFVDLSGGIAVSSLGHCHPVLVAALQKQSETLWHVSNVVTNEPALRLANKLCAASFAERVFFCNSGAEANEAALKLARRWAIETHGPEKVEIISFTNSFHGRTLFTVSVGGQPKYAEGFGPLPGAIRHLPYNDIAALEAAVSDRTCAVIMEPIQGEGGVNAADPAFVRAVRELCNRHQALLVFDEVQSGVGRTGYLYAYMGLDVVPDILTSAKGLGGGFPIGAMLTTEKFAKVLQPGTHGTTYGGNPLACAVAEAVIDTVNDCQLLQGVIDRGARLRAGLEAIGSRHGIFERIRGQGLLLGAVLTADWRGRAKDVVAAGMAHGVWMLMAGPDVVRFAPSLVIPEADIDEALLRLERAVAALVTA